MKIISTSISNGSSNHTYLNQDSRRSDRGDAGVRFSSRGDSNSYDNDDDDDDDDDDDSLTNNNYHDINLLESVKKRGRRRKRRGRLQFKLKEKLSTNSYKTIKDTDLLKSSSEGTFRVHKIFGDGNCMYRSVSYIIWGDENEHRSLRTMVVEHITDNWPDYSAFVMAEWNISKKKDYHDYMMTNGTYATELECVVATKLYQMNLSIYRKFDNYYGKTNLERIFHNRVNKNYRTARLLFSGRNESGHFDVLIPD